MASNKKVKSVRIDIDKHQEIAGMYNVESVPYLIHSRYGKELATTVGASSKCILSRFIITNIDLKKR